MRIYPVLGAALLAPVMFMATGFVEEARADPLLNPMSIHCVHIEWSADYDTMCLVYHEDGSVERFFVRR